MHPVMRVPGIKTVDQVLFRELVLTLLLSLGILISTLFLNQMLRFSDLFLQTGIPFSLFLRFLLYVLPFFLVITLPVAALMASLLTFSRMGADREYTAYLAAGVPPYRLLLPVLFLSLLLTGAGLWISLVVQPWSGTSLKQQFYEALKNQRNFGLQEGVFNVLFDRVVYVDRIVPPSRLHGVLISDHPQSPERNGSPETQIVSAETGSLWIDPATSAVFLRLENGGIHRLSGDQLYQTIQFSAYMLKLGVDDPIRNGGGIIKDQWVMSLAEFRAKLADLSPRVDQAETYRAILLEYHKKFALPAAALLFGLLGAPVGALIRSASRFAGFGLGILLVAGYYLLVVASEFLNGAGLLPPIAAAWLPNGIAGLLGVVLVRRMTRGA
ncbi:MAG: LptF/LptG family permease [Nitrospirae bacterium]|nr:LptF/LptG family permease [Nitrospirota bacterium]